MESPQVLAPRSEANTIRALADLNSTAEDFIRPGHIFPLIAVEGGLAARRGHTEAVVEMCYRAGATPVGVISELVNEDGSMLRGQALIDFAIAHEFPWLLLKNYPVRSHLKSKKRVRVAWANFHAPMLIGEFQHTQGKVGVAHAVMVLG